MKPIRLAWVGSVLLLVAFWLLAEPLPSQPYTFIALRNALVMPLDHFLENFFVCNALPSRLLNGTNNPALQRFILQGIDPCAQLAIE